MRTIYVNDDLKHISIGKEAENDALVVLFPTEDWITTYGDSGTFYCLVKRPGDDESPYFAELDSTTYDGYVAWIVSNADVGISGYGKCELQYVIGDMIAKSRLYTTLIEEALGEGGDAPDPSDSWLVAFYNTIDEVWEAVEIARTVQGLVDVANNAASEASNAASSAAESQAICENIAEVGGYTRTEMDALLANKADTYSLDAAPTSGSTNLVTSGAVYNAISNVALDVDSGLDNTSANPVENQVITNALANKAAAFNVDAEPTQGSTNPLSSGGAYDALANKANSFSTDSAPTSGSANLVTSGGVYDAIEEITITVDSALSSSSTNPVQNKLITNALANKAATFSTDSAPTSGSTNLVTSGGVYAALQNVTIDMDTEPISGSNNAVTSDGVYNAVMNLAFVIDDEPTASSNNAVSSNGVYYALADKANASHTHAASDIASGALSVSRGGTGKATHTNNAILTGNTVSAVRNVLTANGAFYATAANGAAKFGTLPIAQGGTGLTSSPSLLVNLASTASANVLASAPRPGATGVLPIAKGGTGNSYGYIRTGMNAPALAGNCATAEGYNCSATGNCSHAEGVTCVASGDWSHAGGGFCIASNSYSIACGVMSNACAVSAQAYGYQVNAAAWYQTAFGACNVVYANSSGANTSAYLIVGKGSSAGNANAFRIAASAVYGAGAYNSSGADYAELFEWADGNPGAEDRAGLFVTLTGDRIRVATPEDDFVLGIVSGNPSVCGDVFDDQWQGMYETDIFGRPLWEDVEVEAEYGPDGEEIIPAHTETRQKLNPEYDNSTKYQARTERPEWDAVGIMGKLVAVDDGTCEADGWATIGDGGKATASAERTKYRVMARLDETHIKILIL